MKVREFLIDRYLTDLAARYGYDVNELREIFERCLEDEIEDAGDVRDDFFDDFERITMEHDWLLP